ncbi:Apolipoprotein N-acyltransferase [Anatilimnocola aggregata]|uniref:Apolipoprotein N-acyltransferase n=1 Tax=Anatilimnocola aggregata TaxID=2528021 RepID=A0A517Y9E5_9BACT|nr:apolipoprotein N-acyltransferase [Anatilimnocola aggregata]QDU26855.1 Apolipoprotein N-acyltransferase [Anatilimnocola aggregata]
MKAPSLKQPKVAVAPTRRAETKPATSWWQWPLPVATLGALLLWTSFPPLDLWPLAWLAPVPWLILIRQPKLLGPKPYLQIWFAGFVHWLLMLQGIRLAHPALYGGWLALSAYLAVYLVLFISIARVAVQQLRWPLFLAAPIVFVGLELFRGHLISGFSCGLLAHTQTELPVLLQIADLGGAYTLSFVMMLCAAAIAQLLPKRWFVLGDETGSQSNRSFLQLPVWPVVTALALLMATVGYGYYRLQERPPAGNRPPLKVALIQGSLDTRFDQDFHERVNQNFTHYGKLTSEAVADNTGLDLVVWPESAFAIPEYQAVAASSVINANDPQVAAVRERFAEAEKPFQGTLSDAIKAINKPKEKRTVGETAILPVTGTSFLFGTTTLVIDLNKPDGAIAHNYNAALLAGPTGQISGRYYKMHAVMFGEFIPVADLLPFLYGLTPMGAGMSTGKQPAALSVKGYNLSPNICFESTVPHLIREQVLGAERTSQRPIDAIVNVTNDGWFWGSSILDLHFRCSVFRAIENRKPVVIAANTGISAHIDGNGRVLQRGPKREPKILVADVIADGRTSPYHLWGDSAAWLCAALTWAVAFYGVWHRKVPATSAENPSR